MITAGELRKVLAIAPEATPVVIWDQNVAGLRPCMQVGMSYDAVSKQLIVHLLMGDISTNPTDTTPKGS